MIDRNKQCLLGTMTTYENVDVLRSNKSRTNKLLLNL